MLWHNEPAPEPLDGRPARPATRYPHMAGAYGPEALRELEARRQAGSDWPSEVDQAIDPWTGRGTEQ
ncbi:hypothetical protein C1I95_12525 [Micromonospora craterilacus]|uniref:Uncharacterized protein n=1 Tax=Micromonospora craterilacus TaxID=1655439 RepID=A0A2W2ER34_9ACTN|nr:hypothetical protein [Micromonospora craterilacus]PZG18995.1 hypothetical protein C1I95_12525 [Micromonospora craterilacus]